LNDQHQGKGGEQLKQLRRFVNAAQQQHLYQRAQQTCDERRAQQHQKVGSGLTGSVTQHHAQSARHSRRSMRHKRVRHIHTQHEERAMRKIDDARHAKDERQTAYKNKDEAAANPLRACTKSWRCPWC
jgi:hypothetical protein